MASGNNPCEQFNAVLREFGEHVGLDGLTTSEEGVCTLSIDDELLLNLLVNPKTATLIAWLILGDVPEVNREAFLAKLLRANLFWHKSRGCTLSLMPDSDAVVTARSFPLESLNVDRLKWIITEFVEFTDEYRQWLQTDEASDDADQALDEDAIRV